MMNQRDIYISEIVDEVFFPTSHRHAVLMRPLIRTDVGQDEYLQVLKETWVYYQMHVPGLIGEYVREHHHGRTFTGDRTLLFEAALYASYWTTRNCEDMTLRPEDVTDVGSVSLEEHACHLINNCESEDVKACLKNVLDLIYDRNTPRREYDLDLVNVSFELYGIMRSINRFVVNRDTNTVPEYVCEGDSEENGNDSDNEEDLFPRTKPMLPNTTYKIDLNQENPDIETDSDTDFENDYFNFKDISHEISRRYCNHKNLKCPCMYSCRYKDPTDIFKKTKGYQIDELSYRDLCAINSELPTSFYGEDPKKNFKNHFVVKIALTTSDKNIRAVGTRTKGEIMKQINRIRSYYLEDLPPSIRMKFEDFVAENDDEEASTGMFERITAVLECAGSCLKSATLKVVETFKKMIGGLTDFISAKISQLVESVFTKISEYVVQHFDIDEFITRRVLKLKEGVLTNGRKVAIALTLIMFFVAVEILGIFAFRFVSKMIGKLTGLFGHDNDCFDIQNDDLHHVAEGMSPIAAVATMACTGFGLATGETRIIKEKCDFISSVLRAGTGISLTLGALFVILPTIFKDTITMAWGTPEEKDALIAEDWVIKSTCVIRLSKIAKVLASEEMTKWVKEQLNVVPDLIKRIKTTGQRSIVLKIYSDLVKISMNLEQYHNSDNVRNVPYSIHLSADPGFGKSLLTPVLIQQAFEKDSNSIYTRNQTEEYWSGYIAQPVVFIDEFLVNKDANVANRSADEYLKLVSPSKFTPEFASTDNIVMGLKGTTVSPEIIVTANNSSYPYVSGFPKGAMDRRRRFVIRMYQNPAKINLWSGKNQINVGAMAEDDLRNVTWLLFDVMNSSRNSPETIHQGLTFKNLIALLRDDYKSYKADCDKMNHVFKNDNDTTTDPTVLLTEMMAEMKGTPRGTFNYDNPLGAFLNTATHFFGEGKTKPSARFVTPQGSEDENVTTEDAPSTSRATRIGITPCPEGIINRDIPSDIYCSNVDINTIHRHPCLVCNKHQAVRSCDGTMHLRCVSCEKSCKRIPHERMRDLILREPLVITEEEMEIIREQRTADMVKLLAASRFTVFFDGDSSFCLWEQFGYHRDYYDFASRMKQAWKVRAKTFAILISIYVSIMFIRRSLNKRYRVEEPSELRFIPEFSAPPEKRTEKRRSNYKATNTRGQASAFSGLKYCLTVDGKKLTMENGVPICSSMFLTHRHSLLDSEGNIYANGLITVYFRDGIDTVRFTDSMVRELKINDKVCDFVLIRLPPRMKTNAFPNTLSKFWRDEDFMRYNGGDMCIVHPDGSTSSARATVQNNKVYSFKDKTFRLESALAYNGVGNGPGWCGLMLESYGNICPGMFIGMHVAGSGSKGRSDGLYGLAVPITREMVENLINYHDEGDIPTDVEFSAQSSVFEGPGLVSCEQLPPRERVILTRSSKIRPSCVAPHMPEEPKKHPPLLSPSDPRANNEDPLVNMINDTLSKMPPSCDEQRARRAVAGTMSHLRKNLNWVFPKRRLTFEEAVGGVPGLLTSMNRNTSAGYPLCKITKGKGKREYFWFGEENKLCWDPLFKELVENFIERFDNGECELGRFVAYLKDELVSSKKIKQKRCRIIYGGDMIANTAFRMIFGSFVIAYNHSYDKLTHSVGLNQYSYDLDSIYSYLSQVGDKFVAGDFKGWDKNMNPFIQKQVYYGIMQTCSSLINSRNYDSLYQHQVKSPVIVERHLLTFENTQFSGCFFTTILNCLVHDAMLRYIFELNCEKAGVNLDFETNVRAKILGDDHIYCFSDEAAKFMTPKDIQDAYKDIGSEYTDDLKEAEVGDKFRSFEELTFLGAHPKMIEGKWVGALKKDTIEEMVLWTRDFNDDLEARCLTAIEMASTWGEDYYVERVSLINDALRRVNRPQINAKPWLTMIHDVVNRTAANEATFPRYVAEGNEGLVNLNAKNEVVGDALNKTTLISRLRSKAVAEIPQDLSFGLESTVYRHAFEWETSHIAGKAIESIAVPFGLLGLGDSDNVQNMPFDRFLFWNGDVTITFQVNGTPFMCGMLAVYFMPLADYECELANISTTNHVFLQPDKNNTVELTIPFIYFRTVMNTVARTTESLGTIHITPMSPLSSVDGTPVTISVYSSFPRSNFSVPRPLPVTRSRPKKFYSALGQNESDELNLPTTFVAEGASQSTNVTNTYVNSGGTMPISDIKNDATADLDFAPDVNASMKIPVGLDNPPLASGAFPVELAYPGFSTSYGVRPTRDLQLMPATFSRQQCMIFDPAETRIDVNCMRNCLLTTIPISTSMAANTTLLELSLDSRLNLAIGSGIPVNLAVLNQFHFWRGDIEFTFTMVRTQYHSCRLQGVIAYGVNAIETGSRSVAYSNVMDFSGENSVCSMKIEYNAQTEFLRTFEGSNVVDPLQNHSLGTFGLFITNQLVAPETVPQSIDLLVFVRFLNVKVAVPRAFSPFTWNGYGEVTATDERPLTLTSLPQDVSGGSWPAWANDMLDNAFLPVITASGITMEDGTYTANGSVNFSKKSPGTGGWTSQITAIRIATISGSKRVGIMANNLFINYIFPSRDGALASTPLPDYQRWAGWNLELVDTAISVFYPINPTFVAEGNEEEPITNTDHVEPSETTADSEERPNVVHKVEPMAKFEFCPSDIIEIGRRYVRVQFIDNPNLDQTVRQSTLNSAQGSLTYTHAATQLCSMWRGLFAAWAGSLKYRFFTSDSEHLEILFQPFFNGGNQFNISIGDVIRGSVGKYGTISVVGDTSVVGPYAREMGFPSWHRQYVDVSVPFQSHFNFLFTSKTQEIAPISSGTITLSGVDASEEIRVYSAFGDDLRLGVYRPPRQTNFNLSSYVDGISGFWSN